VEYISCCMKLVLNNILICCICRRTVEWIGIADRLITQSVGAACGCVGGGRVLLASKGCVCWCTSTACQYRQHNGMSNLKKIDCEYSVKNNVFFFVVSCRQHRTACPLWLLVVNQTYTPLVLFVSKYKSSISHHIFAQLSHIPLRPYLCTRPVSHPRIWEFPQWYCQKPRWHIVSFFAACSNILSFVWQFYVTSFAHSAILDHILGVVHGSLLTLPWDRFWPSLQDLEYMLKVQTFSHLSCKV